MSRDAEFRVACGENYVDQVKRFLDEDFDLNVRGKEGRTGLMEASQGGHSYVVEMLLEKGADVNASDDNGSTALKEAAAGGHYRVVELLLDRGANANTPDASGRTPLMAAARGGHDFVVDALLARGVNVNVQDHQGLTALMEAARGGHQYVVDHLLRSGADVTATTVNNETAFWLTAEHVAYRYHWIMVALLEKGAEVNIKDKEMGRTPLDLLDSLMDTVLARGAKRSNELEE